MPELARVDGYRAGAELRSGEQGWWAYDQWPARDLDGWGDAARGSHPHDNIDFHVDLGCGRVPKGRIGVDRYPAPGVAVICDFDGATLGSTPPWRGPVTYEVADPGQSATTDLRDGLQHRTLLGLPFPTDSIESIITHHALEHVGEGFMTLMDECYRVLKPDALMRIIVPLFPSTSAVEDPDHCRYFMAHHGGGGTFDAFCGTPGESPTNCWLASFSVPYTQARFEKVHQDITARLDDPGEWWGPRDAREMRVTLRAVKDAPAPPEAPQG